jgi:hypothetical protein
MKKIIINYEQPTNIITADKVTSPYIFARYNDIGNHIAMVTRQSGGAYKFINLNMGNALSDNFKSLEELMKDVYAWTFYEFDTLEEGLTWALEQLKK